MSRGTSVALVALVAFAGVLTLASAADFPTNVAIYAKAQIAAPSGQNSTGKGKSDLTIYTNGTATCSVNLTGSLEKVTMAHIHLYNVSAGNPIFQGLLPLTATPLPPVLLNPPLTYKGSFKWTTTFPVADIATYKRLLKAKLLYVNVHTVAVPGGAIQGYLKCRHGC